MARGYPEGLPAAAGEVTDPLTCQAIEYGAGPFHVTRIILDGFVVGTSANGASLAIGAQFYQLPTVNCYVTDVAVRLTPASTASVKTDVAEWGIGSAQASGAVATLSGTMEDYVDGGSGGSGGNASNTSNTSGSGTVRKSGLTTVKMVTANSSTFGDLWLNAAAAWSANANGIVTVDGCITIVWYTMGSTLVPA